MAMQDAVLGRASISERLMIYGALLALLLAGFFLRVHALAHDSFWLDEAYSWGWIVNTTWNSVWLALTEFSDVSPLYYVVGKLCAPFFGVREFGLRLPSVFVGLITIPVVYRLGKALAGAWVGVLAAALIALSPYAVWHSRDARPYALYLLFSALALWGFWRAERGRGWLMLILSSMAWYVTHYLSALFAYTQAVYSLTQIRRQPTLFRRWAFAQAIAVLPVLAWVSLFLSQKRLLSANWWIPNVNPFMPFQTLWNFFSGDATTWSVPMAIGVVILTALIGWGAYLRRRSRMTHLLLWWMLLPVATAWLFSLRQPSYADRYFFPAMVPAGLLLGCGLMGLPKVWRGALAAILVVGLTGGSLRIYGDPVFVKQQWRDVARIVEAEQLPVGLSDPQSVVVILPYIATKVQFEFARNEKELSERLAEGPFLFIVPSPVKNETAQALSKPAPFDPLTEGPDFFVHWLKAHPAVPVRPYTFTGAAVVVIGK